MSGSRSPTTRKEECGELKQGKTCKNPGEVALDSASPIFEGQLYDQLDRANELSNIITAIEDTQPAGFCLPRLKELVEENRIAAEHLVDAL